MANEKSARKTENPPESYLAPPPAPPAGGKQAKDKGLFSGLRVSLMPEDLRGKETANLKKAMVVFGLVVVVETAAIGTAYFLVRSYSDNQAVKLDELVSRTQAVQSENAALEQKLAGESSFGPQLIAGQAALDEHLAWTPLFRYLETITLPTVSYINFNGIIEKNIVVMNCLAESYRDVAEQVTLFQQADRIDDVLVSAVSAAIDDSGVLTGVNFSVNIVLKPGAWDADRLFDENGKPVVDEAADKAATESGTVAIPARVEGTGAAAGTGQ